MEKGEKKWTRAPKDMLILSQEIENEIDIYEHKSDIPKEEPLISKKAINYDKTLEPIDHHNNLDFYYCYQFHVCDKYYKLLKGK